MRQARKVIGGALLAVGAFFCAAMIAELGKGAATDPTTPL